MSLRFPAYDRYRRARVASNDAMIALMIGSRLGQHLLDSSAASPQARLPILFRQLEGIERLNVTSREAADLLRSAETLLVMIAIPFVLSVHEAFLGDAILMLKADGKDPASSTWAIPRVANVEKIPLDVRHSYIAERSGFKLPERELEIFALARSLRNRIVHYAGNAGPNIVPAYRAMSTDARSRWRKIAGRNLSIDPDTSSVVLQEGELRVVLATERLLGIAVNEALAAGLSRPYWASVVVEDYENRHPSRFVERAARLRRICGFAKHTYGSLDLTEDEIAVALTNSEGRSSY